MAAANRDAKRGEGNILRSIQGTCNDNDQPASVGGVLSPFDADDMESSEVSTLVNSAANNNPEVIARIA